MYLVMFELNFKLGYYWSVLELAYMASISATRSQKKVKTKVQVKAIKLIFFKNLVLKF